MPDFTPDAASKKWARVTPGRTEDYSEGVKNPSKDWARNTAAAEENYKKGVTEAANKGRFGKGVSRAGTAAWQAGAVSKGINRWGEGVGIAQEKYEAGIAPYASGFSRLSLPPRYPKGDPRNYERSKAVGQAFHKIRTGS